MIVEFLEGTGIDNHGRRLDQVVAEDDEYWEHTHNFIQWLFPLDEESRSVRGSPVLAEEHILAIRESESARNNLQRSVTRYKGFLASTTNWRSGYDCKHLRISGVIKCLRLLVNNEGANTFKYWAEDFWRSTSIHSVKICSPVVLHRFAVRVK